MILVFLREPSCPSWLMILPAPFLARESAMGSFTHVRRIDNQFPTAYNLFMDSLDQQSPPAEEERDTSRLIIMIAVTGVIGAALVLAFLLRQPPKPGTPPPPHLTQLKLSDFKMSAAENFIGATVSYIDGNITNTGNKTVTRVIVEVNFEDSMGQLAQREDLPLRVVRTNGAYLEPVILKLTP